MSSRPKYSRVLLKLSGEAFADADNSISPTVVESIARQLADVAELGVGIGVDFPVAFSFLAECQSPCARYGPLVC